MVQSSDSKCCSHMGGKEEDSRGRVREKTGATVPGAVGSEHGLKHVTEVRGPLNFALSPQPCVQDPGKKFSPTPTECLASYFLLLECWIF